MSRPPYPFATRFLLANAAQVKVEVLDGRVGGRCCDGGQDDAADDHRRSDGSDAEGQRGRLPASEQLARTAVLAWPRAPSHPRRRRYSEGYGVGVVIE